MAGLGNGQGLVVAGGPDHNLVAVGRSLGGDRSLGGFGLGRRDITHIAVLRLAGRSDHIGGHCSLEQLEGQLGIVNEDITGAGDGLNGVVTAQLPGIDRVSCHPVQEDSLALNNTGRTPHVAGVAPTDIDIQHDTGNITTQVVSTVALAVGIVVASALAVSRVAAATVFRLSRGAQHHDIILAVAGIIALAVGPGMLTVPGVAAVPAGANGVTGIERRDLIGSFCTTLAVSVLEQISGSLIAGLIGLIGLHQILQLQIQRAGRRTAGIGRSRQRSQLIISDIIILIELLCIGGQEGSFFLTGAPVVDVTAAVAIVHIGRVCRQFDCRHQADAQHECHQQGQTAFYGLIHK